MIVKLDKSAGAIAETTAPDGPLALHEPGIVDKGTDLPKSLVWILFAGFCAVWLYTLGVRTLVPTDEGRYAEIAREMAVTGDFITPRLNGIKYYGKPPLQAWMNALTFRALGIGEWQARLWSGVCGLLGIVLIAYAGRKVFGERVGLVAGMVLASTLYWGIAGHVNSYDMSLAAMMTLALCALMVAQRDGATLTERRNWMLVCWAGMAMAVLSKGLVGVVLPGAVLAMYTLVARDWTIWKRLHSGIGVPLFLAIAAPWFVLASITNPEFPGFFFIREHFQRFTTNVHQRGEPWHYFIPFFMAGALPWVALVPPSLMQGQRGMTAGFQPKKLLATWVILIFVFFSMSRAKLPSYILPVFPALALLIACHVEAASHRALMIAAGVFGACCAVLLALVPIALGSAGRAHEIVLYKAYAPWIVAAAVLGLAGSVLSGLLARRRKQWAILMLAAAGFLSGQLLLAGHEPIGRDKAGVSHLPAIKAELGEDTPIYAVGLYEYSLPFYLGRTLTLVEYAADGMQLGLKQEPHLWLPQRDGFVERWNADHASGRKAIAILRPDIFIDLENRRIPMHVIARDPRRVIVTNGIDMGAVPVVRH